ncbi:MAG: SDR family oxidoreductase [Thermodesulfovibrionales bacterium]|nr:SDR family oxidoreductase [Thermodesulfovibrionales bacterium]
MKKFSLKGKTSVVFGGAGLIGREITSALAQAGAKTLILDVKSSRGKETASELKGRGLDVGFTAFDVSKLKGIEAGLKRLWKDFSPIDIVVNSSYPRTADWGAKCGDVPLQSWRKNVDMQLNSAFAVSRAMAELMKENRVKGSIINIGSIYGIVGNDFTVYEGTKMTSPAAYSAIKAGITGLTRYMASYYGGDGIRFNILCPGGIFDKQNPGFVKNYSKRTPLKRMGRPDEVASAALFLASDASSYITGTAFMVDGGWTAV